MKVWHYYRGEPISPLHFRVQESFFFSSPERRLPGNEGEVWDPSFCAENGWWSRGMMSFCGINYRYPHRPISCFFHPPRHLENRWPERAEWVEERWLFVFKPPGPFSGKGTFLPSNQPSKNWSPHPFHQQIELFTLFSRIRSLLKACPTFIERKLIKNAALVNTWLAHIMALACEGMEGQQASMEYALTGLLLFSNFHKHLNPTKPQMPFKCARQGLF